MKKQVIHTITIKLKTRKHITTDVIWARIAHLMEMDKFFTDDNFDSILVTGKNSLETKK